MSGQRSDHPDAKNSALRARLAAVDREISRLPVEYRTADGTVRSTDALRRVWADLVELLALGPEPEVRECPYCGHLGMRAATLCGYCWKKLTPPPKGSGSQG